MIYIYTGEDTMGARAAMRAALGVVREKNPQAREVRFDDLSFDSASAQEILSSQGMFGGAHTIIFDGIMDHLGGEDFYSSVISGYAETGNNVFIREKKLPKQFPENIKKTAQLSDFPLKQKKVFEQDNFKIADAIGRRDKKEIWVEFEKMRRGGAVMEELHGILFWAFKSMLIAGTVKKEDAIASGMKDFTYRKYQGFARKFTVEELEQNLTNLKDIYHKAHQGEGELDVFLELFLLRL